MSSSGEIEQIHDAVKIPYNAIDTKQVQDRENWEYTAREFLQKYRFDTVFAADLLQYIQGGMESTYGNEQRQRPRKRIQFWSVFRMGLS